MKIKPHGKGVLPIFSAEKPQPLAKDPFLSALQAPADRPHLIAEIKKASPSRGDIWSHAPIQEIAKAYEDSGAAAISVLTNEAFFRGKLTDLTAVESVTKIPLLCKDFILFPEQIAAARLAGANAVLLMVSVLKTAPKIKELLTEAERWNLDALVETHSAAEISIAHEAGAQIIGVNARSFLTWRWIRIFSKPCCQKFPLASAESQNRVFQGQIPSKL